MAGATSQLTISKAIEIAYQNKHNHIDPALATFLDQTIDGIWQRVKAQPSTYLFTREEFAVFTYYRSRFDDNEIAQQAVRRFWELQVSSQPTGAMSADMYLPPLEGDPKLWHEQVFREHPERLPLANSISVAPEKTASERLTLACQGCRKRRIRCDKKRPVCTSCWVRDITSECYYHGRIKDERLAGPNANADESNGFRLKTPRSISFRRRKVAADQIKEIEAKKFIEESEVKTPEDNLKKQSHIVESRDSSFERQKQQTSAIGEVDNGHLETADTSRMHATNGEEFTLVNSIKLYVESLTGEAWDWWPLRPSFRQLLEDEIRIQWHCVLGHSHWTVLSQTGLVPLQETMKRKAAAQSTSSQRKKPSSPPENNSSTSTGRSSGSNSSTGSSSPNTSESGSSVPSDDYPGSDKSTNPPSTSTVVEIVPPNKLKGFVLFGVQGSKRLQSARLRLAQIDIEVHKDDDSFFDEMTIQYRKLRGFLRRVFSIWVFHTCDFVMFYKANPNEIMPGPKELPPVWNQDYKYDASRNPPILQTVFNAKFYGCNKACIKSQLDLLCFFHECTGRNHCGKYRILERLPKRQRKWETDRDEEPEEAWGLNVAFGVSFFTVVVYHMLILAGPVIFWGIWLKSWPRDWQNASVPFFAVAVLLSLFWLPFSHDRSSADEKSGLKKKKKAV